LGRLTINVVGAEHVLKGLVSAAQSWLGHCRGVAAGLGEIAEDGIHGLACEAAVATAMEATDLVVQACIAETTEAAVLSSNVDPLVVSLTVGR
jgi:hypothetical protein